MGRFSANEVQRVRAVLNPAAIKGAVGDASRIKRVLENRPSPGLYTKANSNPPCIDDDVDSFRGTR